MERNAPCPCGSGKKFKKCCFQPRKPSRRSVSPFSATATAVTGKGLQMLKNVKKMSQSEVKGEPFSPIGLKKETESEKSES